MVVVSNYLSTQPARSQQLRGLLLVALASIERVAHSHDPQNILKSEVFIGKKSTGV